jgi:hypothetical protein
MPEATSPAFCPPIPSATAKTHNPEESAAPPQGGTTKQESSLSGRTMPLCVKLEIFKGYTAPI